MPRAAPRLRPVIYYQTTGDLHIVAPQFTRMAWAQAQQDGVDVRGRPQMTSRAWAPLIWWNERTGTVQVQAIPANNRIRAEVVAELAGDTGGAWVKSKLLPIPAQKMLAWGKKQYRPWLSDPPTMGESRTGTLRLSGIGKSTSHFHWGTIEFVNLTRPDFKTHSRSALVELCRVAVVTCQQAWGWGRLVDLKVHSHAGGNAMGLAFNPGQGERIISLNRKLLQDYDEAAILRTILHEICHHAREELHPRSQHNFKAIAHDERFCEMLAQVDPIVADNQKECIYFRDDVWEGGVAAQRRREGEYSADAGGLRLRRVKDGGLRLDWIPEKGRKEVIPFSSAKLRHFLQRFPAGDRKRLIVELGDRRLMGTPIWPMGKLRIRLGGVIPLWWNRWPSIAKETRHLFGEAA